MTKTSQPVSPLPWADPEVEQPDIVDDIVDDNIDFLRRLDAKARASSSLVVHVTLAQANRLNALNGEGEYQHGGRTHAFQRTQLINLVESALRRNNASYAAIAKALDKI